MMIQVLNCYNSVSCLPKKLANRVKHILSCGRLLSYWILKVLDYVPIGVNGRHGRIVNVESVEILTLVASNDLYWFCVDGHVSEY